MCKHAPTVDNSWKVCQALAAHEALQCPVYVGTLYPLEEPWVIAQLRPCALASSDFAKLCKQQFVVPKSYVLFQAIQLML